MGLEPVNITKSVSQSHGRRLHWKEPGLPWARLGGCGPGCLEGGRRVQSVRLRAGAAANVCKLVTLSIAWVAIQDGLVGGSKQRHTLLSARARQTELPGPVAGVDRRQAPNTTAKGALAATGAAWKAGGPYACGARRAAGRGQTRPPGRVRAGGIAARPSEAQAKPCGLDSLHAEDQDDERVGGRHGRGDEGQHRL
jgi:hypothetical protein